MSALSNFFKNELAMAVFFKNVTMYEVISLIDQAMSMEPPHCWDDQGCFARKICAGRLLSWQWNSSVNPNNFFASCTHTCTVNDS